MADFAVVERSERKIGVFKNVCSFASTSPCVFLAGYLRQRGKYIFTFILVGVCTSYIRWRVCWCFHSTDVIKWTYYCEVLSVKPHANFWNWTDLDYIWCWGVYINAWRKFNFDAWTLLDQESQNVLHQISQTQLIVLKINRLVRYKIQSKPAIKTFVCATSRL